MNTQVIARFLKRSKHSWGTKPHGTSTAICAGCAQETFEGTEYSWFPRPGELLTAILCPACHKTYRAVRSAITGEK